VAGGVVLEGGYYFPFRLVYCVAGGGNIGNKAK